MTNVEETLKKMAQGNTSQVINEEEQLRSMEEQGIRIPNIILRKTVESLRNSKMPDKEILDKIIFFDQLAEKGQLVDYLNKLEENGNRN